MARNYINSDVRFVRRDFVLVDMHLPSGECIEHLEPRRLFPLSTCEEYISLLDKDGHEQGIIRSLSSLDRESAAAIRGALSEYYIMPKITSVTEVYEKGNINRWTVMTDHGECTFQIKARYTDIKILQNGRILIRDTNDNRYEIPDVAKLDKHSLHQLNSQI